MAESKPSLSEVSENTSQLLQEATEKTTQTVINHTAKYNDAYSTIDKIMEGFWERVPYLIIAAVVLIVFWLLARVFKWSVRKTLSNRSYTRQNLVLVLNRVGSSAIIFFGFLIAMVIAIPGFTPSQPHECFGSRLCCNWFAFKDIFQRFIVGCTDFAWRTI